MKVRFQREIAIVSLLFLPLFQKRADYPIPGRVEFSPGDSQRIQIGTGKHGVQPILVFLQSAIHFFLAAELARDDYECVFNLAACLGFKVYIFRYRPITTSDIWGSLPGR